MKPNARLSSLLVIVVVAVAGGCMAHSSTPAPVDAAPTFGATPPDGYRDWRLITVAHEEGTLNDLRGVLGNAIAVASYRSGKLPFAEGSIIARLAWRYESSDEYNKVFGRAQSFVAGPPVNGVQFMLKDSRKYAATGGWGFAQFNDGKPVDDAMLKPCFPCHSAIEERDFVFSRYSK